MLLFCMLLKKENCHDPDFPECLRCQKREAARPWKHGSAYKTISTESSLGSELGLSMCRVSYTARLDPHTAHGGRQGPGPS